MTPTHTFPTIGAANGNIFRNNPSKHNAGRYFSVGSGDAHGTSVYNGNHDHSLAPTKKNLQPDDYERIQDYEALPRACILKNLIQ